RRPGQRLPLPLADRNRLRPVPFPPGLQVRRLDTTFPNTAAQDRSDVHRHSTGRRNPEGRAVIAPTAAQQQAVQARGNGLLAAGAGTGKTRTLVQRCLSLLQSGCSLDNILVVTFTEAAATEMRARMRLALQDALDSDSADAAARRDHLEKQLTSLETAPI